MLSLRECVANAAKNKIAIGHFNVSNLETLWGIFNAARRLNAPVIIGVSEGERDFMGVGQVAALVKSFRNEFNYPIFLNADHTYSFERVKEAIDAGFDSVIFDGAKLPFSENINVARQCVKYAKNCGRDVLVEGELGYIGASSKVLDAIPADVDLENLTSPEDAKKFVEETGVDLLAPAVGNIHGMLKSGKDPALDVEKIKEIYLTTGIPLVLHGASGNSSEDIKKAIKNGIGIVHINTEIRVAFRKILALSLQNSPEEVAPYKYLKPVIQEVEKVIEAKIILFSSL